MIEEKDKFVLNTNNESDAKFSRENYVGLLVIKKYKDYAQKVITQLKEHPSTRDDYSNAWEDFKEQIQLAHDYSWWAFEVTIQQFCESVLFQLPDHEKRLLWLWSNGYISWYEEDISDIPYTDEDVIEKLYSIVCEIAVNEDLEDDIDDEENEEEEDWEDEENISDDESAVEK